MNNSQSNLSPQRKAQTSHFLTTPGDHLTRSEQNLESETPFCRTCTANQALQMNLLANYLPNETEDDHLSGSSKAGTSSEMRRLLDALPQYKESLEARYPVLCSECSPKVSAIIQKRNYKSKAYVLHSSARRLSQLPSTHHLNTDTRPEIISPFNRVTFQRPLIKGMGSRLWILQEWVWRLRGVLWMFSHLSGVLCFNAVAYILRLFSLLLTQEPFLSYLRRSRLWVPDLVSLRNPRTFGIISITLAMLFVSCLYSLRIDSPIRLTSTKKSNVQSTLRPKLPIPKPVSDEDLFSTLSLSASQNISANHKPKLDINQNNSNHETPIFGKSTALSNPLIGTSHQIEETSENEFGNMDWEPINTPKPFNESVLLHPQTFLPPVNHRDEIGIEDMFKESFNVSCNENNEKDKKRNKSLSWTDWIPGGFLRRGAHGSKAKDR
ncbi:uncharacterized protein MELLADRAFT_113971 [Melampsora larici-populina 98AG31]|uniref:Ima1 N-terminal domain-containing protein n=1 Tax=Melampsora larici-populina (strain 98AG31 / pathotype 3-4-7) TaxID=747676 RepID=F4SBP9_MELLP|nr:uncharacterized protein MELLADRAFT_113971 [Melampsora larici-populina 98AG31]EGF97902.1 hypothetical protein MELLADRAFT_113971 [Melampsora larici-populina 98AG31]